MEFTNAQQVAKYRVQIKRQLRLLDVEFNNDDSTTELERKLQSANKEAGESLAVVTFDMHAPRHLAGKTIKAQKQVNVYSSTYVEHGRQVTETWENVVYVYDGMTYGEEFFVA